MTRTIYFYFDAKGVELCTPNREVAFARAAIHGTHEVYSLEVVERSMA